MNLIVVFLLALPGQPPAPEQNELWDRPSLGGPAAAAQVVGLGHPLEALALFDGGRRLLVWPEVMFDRAPALSPFLLGFVRDEKVFPDFRGMDPHNIPKHLLNEKLAYVQALVNSHITAPELFQASAKENDWLAFPQLYNEPAKHRGKVMSLQGKLVKLLRFDPPLEAKEQGVGLVWEGWIFLDRPGTKTPPVMFLMTDLPDGIKEGENLKYHVKFDGYFFKKYRYKLPDKEMVTLMFIGPTVKLAAAAITPPAPSVMGTSLIAAIVGVLGGTMLLIGGLIVYFRRSDRLVRAKLARAREGKFFDPGFGADEG